MHRLVVIRVPLLKCNHTGQSPRLTIGAISSTAYFTNDEEGVTPNNCLQLKKLSHNILCLHDDFASMFCFPMLLKNKSPSILISMSVAAMVARQQVPVFQVSYFNALQRTGRNPDHSTKTYINRIC